MRMRSIGSICTATVRGMGVRSGANLALRESVNLQPIRGRRVTGKASGRDEYGVAPKGQARRPGVPRQPYPRRTGDSPPLGRTDRDRRALHVRARLDLDEGDRAASFGDEVDFAAGDDKPARENPIALEAKHERCDRFRLEAKKMGAAPALSPLGAARAAHRAAPASA